ncbi:hypothetical protein [Exiguobacterium algae]|uniref:hypothetical protein n=1 Tax=Exiguobacterium algae TaxID=2751250 RepID=UPI001BE6C55F|nr:hypothetical protein [Exiguobacterium algae]
MDRKHNEKLASFILASEEKIPNDGLEEVRHYYEHGEYEMSFEGLVIELMSVRKYPDNFDFNDWKELAIYYGLDRESVFEGDFWMEFLQWGGEL